jgi:4-hydroxy-tetrahydrodipicolinate reductase
MWNAPGTEKQSAKAGRHRNGNTTEQYKIKKMKIALIGYGKMGKIIERVALERGHAVSCIIDIDNTDDFRSGKFHSSDVAIEFTTPAAAYGNFLKCFEAGVPVVAGTTGWTGRIGEIREICEKEGKTFFYASNYSIGVNVFFAVNRYLAGLMDGFPSYDVSLTEVHHIHKLDAPSGTGITLAGDIIGKLSRKDKWALVEDAGGTADNKTGGGTLNISSVREGEVPGIHEIRYESDVDSITIRHEAKSREGFALGAVLAAEFTAGKKGFLGMNDLLKLTT